MPTERAFELLDELSSLGVQSILFTGGGEPLTHPQAGEIIRRAHSLGFKIGMSTNGGLLDNADIRATILECNTYLRVSVDAGTQKTHSTLHNVNGEMNQILASVKNISAARKSDKPTIGYAFLVSDYNYKEIPVAVVKAMNHGFDYIQFRPVINGKLSERAKRIANRLINKAKQKNNFSVLGGASRNGSKEFKKCRITPLITIIGADLNVYLCCQWRGDLNYSIGSVKDKSFSEVWNSKAHKVMLANLDVNCCHPCKYEKYNEVVERAFLNEEMHLEFL